MDFEQKAKEILAQHPEKNKVFIAFDGQAYFSEGDAKNHISSLSKTTRKGGETYEAFFRNGIAPDTETQETLDEVQNALAERAQVVEDVKKVLNGETIEVSTETDETLAEVVTLKEAHDTLLEANIELKAGKKELQEECSDLKKERDDLAEQLKGFTATITTQEVPQLPLEEVKDNKKQGTRKK